ncbi:hypothetical protein SARC_02547 [Sphaeroforma arctica JP610]|uniref:Chromo domain-containing protein n=1 Tax=Sphaeroforma arctica JP610 TaxID=667725 RepID=A0A0L0G8P2_9EUKA|nr:hypothetical protein SARC_02547 [Sphaeroforma arctica JP610]KNC85251.1 hypothetical protein SARC_02547 [Sphaeroforma arctica JP610]|eukprot:XP_014159153.1 hypothetical protein SARC_02547 [Sphaeroforma arctica JP610]
MCRVAQIPSVLSNPTPEHYRQQLTSRADHSGRLIWQPDNCIDDTELAKYLEAALPTLRVGRTGFNLPTPRDLQITTILATLTLNGCDVDKAKEELQKNAPRTLAWSNSDIVNFEIELVQHGKDFERFKIAGRSYNEIINFYFQWMRSPRCRSFVNTFMDVWYRSNCGPIHDCNEVIINWKRQIGLFRVAAVLDRRKRGTRWEYKVRWEDTDVETWEDKDSKGLRTSEAFSKYKRSLKE